MSEKPCCVLCVQNQRSVCRISFPGLPKNIYDWFTLQVDARQMAKKRIQSDGLFPVSSKAPPSRVSGECPENAACHCCMRSFPAAIFIAPLSLAHCLFASFCSEYAVGTMNTRRCKRPRANGSAASPEPSLSHSRASRDASPKPSMPLSSTVSDDLALVAENGDGLVRRLEADLTCPVCLHLFLAKAPYIMQCHNGHSVCRWVRAYGTFFRASRNSVYTCLQTGTGSALVTAMCAA